MDRMVAADMSYPSTAISPDIFARLQPRCIRASETTARTRRLTSGPICLVLAGMITSWIQAISSWHAPGGGGGCRPGRAAHVTSR